LLVNIRKFSGVLHRSLAELIDRDMLEATTARFLQVRFYAAGSGRHRQPGAGPSAQP
jgi:hypothetical protein